MSGFAGKQSRTGSPTVSTTAVQPSPGKHTLVEQTYGSSGAAPLQRKADGNGAAGPAIADRAVSGHGLQLWAVQRKALRPETESLVASQPEPGPDPGVC
jgi:hypothetical protein